MLRNIYISGPTLMVASVSAIGKFILDIVLFRRHMIRMCFGLVFAGLAVASNTAHSEEGSITPDLAILTIQPVRTDPSWLLPDQFSASVVLTHQPVTTPIGFGSDGTSQFSVTKPQQETVLATKSHWQPTYDDNRISLLRLLRLEFKGGLANISVQPRLISIEGERLKVTFQPQSALIEEGQLKILLQSHSVMIMRSKAF